VEEPSTASIPDDLQTRSKTAVGREKTFNRLGGRVVDFKELWRKLRQCCQAVRSAMQTTEFGPLSCKI
jgi:hypothetical protein